MDIKIEFNPSAFKHKRMTEARIREAIINPLYDGLWDMDKEKRLLLGIDSGNLPMALCLKLCIISLMSRPSMYSML